MKSPEPQQCKPDRKEIFKILNEYSAWQFELAEQGGDARSARMHAETYIDRILKATK